MLSAFGPIEVVVDHDLDEEAGWRRFLLSHPQASLVYRDDRYSAFRVERGRRVAPLSRIPGQALTFASITSEVNAAMLPAVTDGDITTRWHAGREQRPGDAISVDLGSPHQVHGAEMLIAGFVADFPRRLLVETSVDGENWSQAWTGTTSIIALSAALDDPLNVPLTFPFEPREARFVRFTELDSEDTYYWSIAELRILGAK